LNIGNRIRQIREKRNMSLEDVAKAAGTTRQTIFKYENGIITNIPLERLESVSKALGVHPSYLLGWTQESPAEELSDNVNAILELVRDCPDNQAERLLQIMKLFLDSEK
jgi:transcriptional regulator with XRE-family HTH domain